MKKISLLALACVAGILQHCTAQEMLIPGVKPLRVGDKMPDVYLGTLVNYSKKSGRLFSEFGGKPLLLDIWNLTCESCIQGLPLLDSIQRASAGKINILLVNGWEHDSAAAVAAFFKKSRIGRKISLPSTARDSVLKSYFPGEPHKVWIDKNGIILSISEAFEGTRENVQRFIEGKPLHLKQLQREADPGLEDWPLMTIDRDYNHGRGLLEYSYISGYDSTSRKRSMHAPAMQDGRMTLTQRNKDIRQLYEVAYYSRGMDKPFKPLQFIVESHHTPGYDPDANSIYSTAKDLFCYEAMLKDSVALHMYKKMQQDLDRFFNCHSSLELKMLPCYVLRRINQQENRLMVRNTNDRGRFITADSIEFSKYSWKGVETLLNHSLDWVPKKMMAAYLPYVVIDETGYTNFGPFDLTIPSFPYWNDLSKLNAALETYNLRVTLEQREIEVIVLRD